jgi:hypothetical protein
VHASLAAPSQVVQTEIQLVCRSPRGRMP